VAPPPSTHMSQQRDKLYGCFGKAVNCLLFVSWVASRLAKMFDAMPSSESLTRSPKWRRFPNITSRMTIRLQ